VQATQLFEESLALRRELGDKRLIANSLLSLARHELNREQYERATELLEEGLTLARELRDTWQMSVALANLARVQLHEGFAEAAQALFAEALALASDRGDKRVTAECLQGVAAAASMAQPDLAAHIWGAAEALLDTTGATHSPAERAIVERFQPPLKEALGEAAFEAALHGGRSWSFEDAVARAIDASPRIIADPAAVS
jgi:tetratricopeptide (TPR) repeat protein